MDNTSEHTTESENTASQAKTDGLGRRVARKFMTGKGIFTFLRSSVSSQIASWIDMGTCFVFYAWVFVAMGKDPLRSFLATAIGLVVGGVVNCCINYKFTFRAEHCSMKAVAVKYLLIWGGSSRSQPRWNHSARPFAAAHRVAGQNRCQARWHIRRGPTERFARCVAGLEFPASEKFRICAHPFRSVGHTPR